MKELIKRIAESLVDYPDQVSVKEIQGDRLVVYELKVAKSDIGKIIGKQGRNADAIRTILRAVAGKTRKQVLLELIGKASALGPGRPDVRLHCGSAGSDSPAYLDPDDDSGSFRPLRRIIRPPRNSGYGTIAAPQPPPPRYRNRQPLSLAFPGAHRW